MKILQINKFYYKKGGSESHFIALINLLRKNNHQVMVFSTKNKKNISSTENDFFIQEIDMRLSNFKNGFNIFYNLEAVKELRKIISLDRPDVVHIHNVSHHFSPAILKVFKKFNLPVVMTVHDYKLICPNYKLFSRGKICEKCIGGKFYQCALNKCVKDSYLGSLVLALEAYWAKWKKYYDLVDIFIVPSQFMREKLIQSGISLKKIKYLPNFLEEKEEFNFFVDGKKDYILFLGRLSEEKGLDILVESIGEIKNKEIELKIVGEGPLEGELRKNIAKLGLNNRVKILGYKSGTELKQIISQAQFVVVPSCWYENAPYVILESYSLKKAVLGSEIGGIKELIEIGETGMTFKPNDVKDLTNKINYLLEDKSRLKNMGEKGHLFLKYCFNAENYLNRLIKIYQEIISKKVDK